MEIVKKEHYKLNPALGKIESKIVLASRTERLSKIEPQDITKQIMPIIAESLLITGEKPKTQTDIAQISFHVAQMLQTVGRNMRIDEIKLAIKNGAFGMYAKDGDVVFVSPKNIVNWCKAYQTEKLETIKKQTDFEYKEKREEIERQKAIEGAQKFAEQIPEMILQEYDGKRETVNSWTIYNLLDRFGNIYIKAERKREIFEDAKKYVRTQRRTNGGISIETDLDKLAKTRAKTVGLLEWFEGKTREEIEQIAKQCQSIYKQQYNI